MSAEGSSVVAATAIALGSVATQSNGAFAQVFNETGLIVALLGALGGLFYVLAIDTPWSESVRPILMGATLAFGVGAFGPEIITKVFGIDIPKDVPLVELKAATAFLIGASQEWLIRRFFKRSRDNEQE